MSNSGMPSRLQRARKMAKLSRRRLSLLSGLAQAAVGIIERNPASTPTGETLAKLADTLGLSLDWLIAGKREAAPTRETVLAAVERAMVRERDRRESEAAAVPPPPPSQPAPRGRRRRSPKVETFPTTRKSRSRSPKGMKLVA